MNTPKAWIALVIETFAIPLLYGCSSTEKETTYVPTQPQVVVQPAPVVGASGDYHHNNLQDCFVHSAWRELD